MKNKIAYLFSIFNSDFCCLVYDEPSHDKTFATHAHDYKSRHVKHLVRLLASSPAWAGQAI